jgi:hypothetical protein
MGSIIAEFKSPLFLGHVGVRRDRHRRAARRTERIVELSLWLDKHENGPVLGKLQALTFRMHAVLISIGAIGCFALGYFSSPKNQFSPAGILLFVTAFMLTVMVVADCIRSIKIHPSAGVFVRAEAACRAGKRGPAPPSVPTA